jgi:hypothetical protein
LSSGAARDAVALEAFDQVTIGAGEIDNRRDRAAARE